MNHYDMLIVGAGIGGLACGARLSMMGYKVAVFDHHYLPGGYATNFHRKGYTFDVALHGVGGLAEGQSFYQILQACGVQTHHEMKFTGNWVVSKRKPTTDSWKTNWECSTREILLEKNQEKSNWSIDHATLYRSFLPS